MVLVYVLDALEEALVKLHVVGVLGQDRAKFFAPVGPIRRMSRR